MDPTQLKVFIPIRPHHDTSGYDATSLHGSETDMQDAHKKTQEATIEKTYPSSLSTRSSGRQLHSFCSVSLERDVFDHWCRVGISEGLKTDTEIASFFICRYERDDGRATSGTRCIHCQAPLTLVCTSCLQQQDRSSLKAPAPESSLRVKTEPTVKLEIRDRPQDNEDQLDSLLGVNVYFDSESKNRNAGQQQGKQSDRRTKITANHCSSAEIRNLGMVEENDFADGDDWGGCAVDLTDILDRTLSSGAETVQGKTQAEQNRVLVNDVTALVLLQGQSKQAGTGTAETLQANVPGSAGRVERLSSSSPLPEGLHLQPCKFGQTERVGRSVKNISEKVHSDAPLNQNSSLGPGDEMNHNEIPHATLKNLCENITKSDPIDKCTSHEPGQMEFPCTLCEKSFRSSKYLNGHVRNVHMKGKLYKCHFCNKSFISKLYFEKYHMNTHLPTDNPKRCRDGVCPICGKYVKKLADHRVTHSTNRPHKCHLCDAVFKTKSCLKQHVEVHAVDKKYKCETCDKSFKTLISLRTHSVFHRGQHKCSVCSTTLSSKRQFVIHMRRHTGEKPYICDVCGKAFCSNSELHGHKKSKHSESKTDMKTDGEGKPFLCQQCDKAFAVKSNLNKHMLLHSGTLPYLCQLCGATYYRQDTLKAHLKSHVNARDFKCDVCGKAFNTKGSLAQHTRQVHIGREKRFKCSECSYACLSAAELKIHTRKHTGDKPFKCTYCAKAFVANSRLLKHLKRHEGKKTHMCEVCGASFYVSSNLKIHMRKHTGEKPYQCKHCGEAFSWDSGLRWHMRKHV